MRVRGQICSSAATGGLLHAAHDHMRAAPPDPDDKRLRRDESLEDTDNLPAPHVIAAEVVEDLDAALAQFAEIASTLPQSG